MVLRKFKPDLSLLAMLFFKEETQQNNTMLSFPLF